MFKDIATRIVNAENTFIAMIQKETGCNAETAEKVMALYLKEKLAKLHPNIGRIQVSHGAFLDADVLKRAVNHVSRG